MAKNLTKYMPGVAIPAQALDGFEMFFSGDQYGGDQDQGRDAAYGKDISRVCLKETMCDIVAYVHGGGEGGAGMCCCMQGDPGYSGGGNRYSVCCHANAGAVRCDEYVNMCIGPGGCRCTSPNGHEACMSTIHHCNRVSGESYFCVCGNANNGASSTSCNNGSTNSSDIASRGGTCWNSMVCAGANCRAATDCQTGCDKKSQKTTVGWDCIYCTSAGHAGFNMYRGQCCNDGACGVANMSSGPNVTQPYVVGNHIIKSNWHGEQNQGGTPLFCEFKGETGQNGNDYMHVRMTGRSTSPARGCAGGCACGAAATAGWGFMRFKDPDQIENGFGQEYNKWQRL